eukprot:6204317-Pleurochrysis_carterae.AAC.1
MSRKWLDVQKMEANGQPCSPPPVPRPQSVSLAHPAERYADDRNASMHTNGKVYFACGVFTDWPGS